MRQIQPVISWKDGSQKLAEYIKIYTVDNLIDSATFYYTLTSNVNEVLSEGSVMMNGGDYANWGQTEDINTEAYRWVTEKLNLTLL
jgi:hypothetical protein